MALHFPQTLVHWLLAGSAAAAVIFLSVGLTLYFERAPRPPWVMAVHYTSMVFAMLQLTGVVFLTPRSDGFVALGIGMYVSSISIHLAAIESARRTRLQRSFIDHPLPDRLITDGPFHWVRHPFCAGYLLGALAAPVAIDGLWLLFIALPLVLVAIVAATREERVWLSSAHADEYRAYKRRTGMFIPFVGRG
jgi:protein-S-isoprenylcysteine O-methyltransferase Ste14